jgi:hypothetical protein
LGFILSVFRGAKARYVVGSSRGVDYPDPEVPVADLYAATVIVLMSWEVKRIRLRVDRKVLRSSRFESELTLKAAMRDRDTLR